MHSAAKNLYNRVGIGIRACAAAEKLDQFVRPSQRGLMHRGAADSEFAGQRDLIKIRPTGNFSGQDGFDQNFVYRIDESLTNE